MATPVVFVANSFVADVGTQLAFTTKSIASQGSSFGGGITGVQLLEIVKFPIVVPPAVVKAT